MRLRSATNARRRSAAAATLLSAGVTLVVIVLGGCHGAKRARCAAALVELWGPAKEDGRSAYDDAYTSRSIGNCERVSDALLECVLANSRQAVGRQDKVEPACQEALKRYRRP